VLRVSLLGMSCTLVAILLPNQWWMLLFINPFIAIFQGSTQPNQTNLVSQMASRDNQGEILGIQQSIASIAFTIPPVLAGFMVSFDYRLPILASAFMLLLAWLNFFFRFKKQAAV
jgi:DHA1 family tetracycline resistance protein-like MFS transporter